MSEIHDEELFGDVKGEAFIYKRGEHQYYLPHNLHTPSDVCEISPTWIKYWDGPSAGRHLSGEEQREILARAAVLLQRHGFKVRVVAHDEVT